MFAAFCRISYVLAALLRFLFQIPAVRGSLTKQTGTSRKSSTALTGTNAGGSRTLLLLVPAVMRKLRSGRCSSSHRRCCHSLCLRDRRTSSTFLRCPSPGSRTAPGDHLMLSSGITYRSLFTSRSLEPVCGASVGLPAVSTLLVTFICFSLKIWGTPLLLRKAAVEIPRCSTSFGDGVPIVLRGAVVFACVGFPVRLTPPTRSLA